jgi:hypothetical protein
MPGISSIGKNLIGLCHKITTNDSEERFLMKLIEIFYPDHQNDYQARVPVSTVYETVDIFEKTFFHNYFNCRKILRPILSLKFPLKDVVNLHNSDGIRDIFQIKEMTQKIEQKKDILHPTELPNIKLVKTLRGEYVLFDGHHSVLAYMSAGRKYLNEVPHLFVANDDENGGVYDEDINIFFGDHKIKDDWRKYCINWQTKKDKQLCRRIQRNMGELFESIDCLGLPTVSRYQMIADMSWLLVNQEGFELNGEETQSLMAHVDNGLFLESNCGSIKAMLGNLQCFNLAVE